MNSNPTYHTTHNHCHSEASAKESLNDSNKDTSALPQYDKMLHTNPACRPATDFCHTHSPLCHSERSEKSIRTNRDVSLSLNMTKEDCHVASTSCYSEGESPKNPTQSITKSACHTEPLSEVSKNPQKEVK